MPAEEPWRPGPGTGSLRVDPNVEEDHHHLVCTNCGLVRDLPLDVSSVRLSAKSRRGFDVRAVEVIARGLCDTCVAAGH